MRPNLFSPNSYIRCDRSLSLGVNTPNLGDIIFTAQFLIFYFYFYFLIFIFLNLLNLIGKVLKCAGNDDVVTLKSEEGTDNLTLHFESPNQDRFFDI